MLGIKSFLTLERHLEFLLGYGVMVSTVDSKSICSGSNPDTPTMTFKYNGKIISTPNLEKKLKRMKISMDDIEIIDDSIILKEEDNGFEDYMIDKEKLIVCSTKDDIRRVVYVQKGTRPPFKKLFEKQKWNPDTKTGIKEFNDEYFMTMYYEH